jgi:hypothetical protein
LLWRVSQTAEYEQKVHKLDVGLRCLSGFFFLSCVLLKKQSKICLTENSLVLTINKQVKSFAISGGRIEIGEF